MPAGSTATSIVRWPGSSKKKTPSLVLQSHIACSSAPLSSRRRFCLTSPLTAAKNTRLQLRLTPFCPLDPCRIVSALRLRSLSLCRALLSSLFTYFFSLLFCPLGFLLPFCSFSAFPFPTPLHLLRPVVAGAGAFCLIQGSLTAPPQLPTDTPEYTCIYICNCYRKKEQGLKPSTGNGEPRLQRRCHQHPARQRAQRRHSNRQPQRRLSQRP